MVAELPLKTKANCWHQYIYLGICYNSDEQESLVVLVFFVLQEAIGFGILPAKVDYLHTGYCYFRSHGWFLIEPFEKNEKGYQKSGKQRKTAF